MKAKDALVLGAVAGAGLIAWKWIGKVKAAAGAAYDAAVNTTADAMYAAFGPELTGTDYYYVVNFAGGAKHAIPRLSPANADGVDSQGRFTYNGTKYVIRDKKNAAGALEHWAFTP